MNLPKPITIFLNGALAGFIATLPMSAAMVGLRRLFLPRREQHSLPPSKIISRVAAKVGLKQARDEPEHSFITVASHFAYGAAAGASYALLPKRVLSPALQGAIFGVIVWAVGYLGWLPAMNLLRPVPQRPVRRNLLIVASHLVWGSTTGIVMDLLEQRNGASEIGYKTLATSVVIERTLLQQIEE